MKAAYYPILKWKQGEQNALLGLDEDIKDKICPIIEARNDVKCSNDLYLTLDSCWRQRPFIADYAEPSGLLIGERLDRVKELISQVERNNDSDLMICFWLTMIKTGEIDDLLKKLAILPQPICIRIQGKLSNILRGIKELPEIYKKHSIHPSKVILLLDTKAAPVASESQIELITALNSEFIRTHYTTILASGSFPKTSTLQSNKEVVERIDMDSWLQLTDLAEQYGAPLVKYSDYTCHDPTWEQVNENDVKKFGGYVFPLIRVADNTKWLIYKVTANEDAVHLTKLLLRQTDVVSNCPCAGCNSIQSRANSGMNQGNYAQHLSEGIIHHIHTVMTKNLEL